MAYDNNSNYPEKPEIPERRAATSKTYIVEKTLKDRALSSLKRWNSDMEFLQRERAKIMSYYQAEELGNEVEGRSKVVMSDVSDTIESIMPSIMRIFYGGKNIMDIRPVGVEDELKAKLMEEKVNFDIQKGLNGFKLIYSFVKDALMMKTGVVKYYWHTGTAKKRKSFKNLDPFQFQAIIANPKYEIIEIEAKIIGLDGKITEINGVKSEIPVFSGESVTYDVETYKVKRISKPMAEPVPPEEFLFDLRCRELKECAHKKRVHKSELKKYGVSQDEIDSVTEELRENTDLINERFRDLGGVGFITDDKDSEFVFLYELYLEEYNEDGECLPKIVRMFNGEIIGETEDNPYGRPPFAVMSPIIMTHRVCGKSLAELVMEIQKLRTSLVRYILDSIYFSTNGSHVVNPYRIDVDTMMSGNRPGGIVLTKYDIDPTSAIMPLSTQPLSQSILKMLEYVEGPIRENRTGVTRYNQGLDAKSLNRTATGISQIMSASQQRIELIARVFAETGIRDLYQAFVDMNIEFFDVETAIKINEQWVTIKPEDLDGEYDVSIDIGSSTGTKEMAYQQKVQMLQMYQGIAGTLGPLAQQLFTIENVKNIIRTMWEDLGYRNVDMYVAPDGQAPMMPPMMPPMMGGMPPMEGGMNAPNPGRSFDESGRGQETLGAPSPIGVL